MILTEFKILTNRLRPFFPIGCFAIDIHSCHVSWYCSVVFFIICLYIFAFVTITVVHITWSETLFSKYINVRSCVCRA